MKWFFQCFLDRVSVYLKSPIIKVKNTRQGQTVHLISVLFLIIDALYTKPQNMGHLYLRRRTSSYCYVLHNLKITHK